MGFMDSQIGKDSQKDSGGKKGNNSVPHKFILLLK